MEQVEEICDQIILVNKGRKILDGSVTQVKKEFKENHFHIDFDHHPDILTDSNTFEIISSEEHGLVVKSKKVNTTNEVLQHFIEQGTLIKEFHEILPSLSDIFIRLVGDTATQGSFKLYSHTVPPPCC